MPIDLRMSDILLSRILHDLASPIAAASNGAELIEELGGGGNGIGDEALELIGSSARQASQRLTFYRYAFGGAGSDLEMSLAEIRRLTTDYLTTRRFERKMTQDDAMGPAHLGPGCGKVLLNAVVVASDCLPRSGFIEVGRDASGALVVAAKGQGAQIRPPCLKALAKEEENISDLDTRAIVAMVLRLQSERFGVGLKWREEPDAVIFEMKQPA